MIAFLVAGAVIGVLAHLALAGRRHLSVLITVLLGLAGSVIGGVTVNLLRTGDIWERSLLGVTVAVMSAVVLIAAVEVFSRGGTRISAGEQRHERI